MTSAAQKNIKPKIPDHISISLNITGNLLVFIVQSMTVFHKT